MSQNQNHSIIPDAIEPTLGWRVWDISKGHDGPSLASPFMNARWKAGEAQIAQCRSISFCKEKDCWCGLHACKDPLELHKMRALNPGRVLGTVKLWGEVREYEAGYRAEKGYPRTLWAMRKKDEAKVQCLCDKYFVEYGGLIKNPLGRLEILLDWATVLIIWGACLHFLACITLTFSIIMLAFTPTFGWAYVGVLGIAYAFCAFLFFTSAMSSRAFWGLKKWRQNMLSKQIEMLDQAKMF